MPPRCFELALTVGLTTAALACGSRSGVLDAAQPASGGGGTASGGAASGGASGGAPSVACKALALNVPPLIANDTPNAGLDDHLRMTPTGVDGEQITVVFLRKHSSENFELRHQSLRPWQSWPQGGELGPTLTSGIETHSTHQVGRSLDGGWAALVRGPAGPELHRGLDPSASGSASSVTPLQGIEPMFVSLASDGAHLAGTFDATASGLELGATHIDAAGKVTALNSLGCAHGQSPRAGAAAWGDHFLTASSRGTTSTGCPDPKAGPPKHVDFFAVDLTDPHVLLGTEGVASNVIDLRVTATSDGMIVVWSSGGAEFLHAMRVTGTQGPVAGPTVLPQGDALGQSFAIGTLRDQLLIARRSKDGIQVRLMNAAFAPHAALSLPVEGSPIALSVLGSPNGQGALVGWTEQIGGSFSVHLARVDCVD